MSDLAAIYRENLNAYCVSKGWVSAKNISRGSPAELVKRLGKTSSFWSDLLAGRKSFSTDLAYEIEDGLELPRLFLAGDQIDFVDVPRVDVQISAGSGRVVGVEEVVGHLKFSGSFLRSCGVAPGSARVVDVHGASMEPTIKDGAVLLISTNNREPVENQIFAMARPGDGLIVKRLARQAEHWIARSDNRDFQDFIINDGEPITIIGRAVWMGARL
jgi:phage repressor protein C with HTH and peptisase S24 domain